MAQILFNHPCCATCAYWEGSRKINSSLHRVCLSAETQSGKCLNRASGRASSSGVQAIYKCAKYEKWAALK